MAKNLNTTAAFTKSARKPRAAKVVAPETTVGHAETVEATDDFTRLLAELGAAPDMVIELDDAAPAANAAISDADLAAAVGHAEATEIMMESATVESIDAATAPTDGDVATDPAPEAAVKGAKAPKASKVPKEKKVAAPRVHYSDKVARLQARVGAQLGEYTVLETADAMLDDATLEAAMSKTLDIIRAMNIKEKNRASNFIEFLSGKKAKLNHVLQRVIALLERDGYVSTGNDGNLFKDLVAHPYSPASARAMGGNTIGMFADLKVIVPDGKGRFIPNPDSLLLMKAKSMLSAPVAAAAVEDAAVEDAAEESAVEETDELGAEIETLEALLAAA
jgi:hypothetical protein